MSHLDLRYDDLDEPFDDDIRLHSIIENYLQPETETTLHESSVAIHAMLPRDMPYSPEVRGFGEICIRIAERIPYNHPLQLKLVDLLDYLEFSPHLCAIYELKPTNDKPKGQFDRLKERIKSSPRLRAIMEVDETKRCREPTGQFVRHSRFADSMRDNLNIGPDPDRPGRFVNFHCFAANLCDRQVFCRDPTWAVWAISEAHEDVCKAEGESRQLIRDELMMAAAQWILCYGQGLFKLVIFSDGVDPERISQFWNPGELYQGKGGLSLARWRFWKDGFAAVTTGAGEKEGYGEECVKVSARAAKIMDALESMAV